MLIRKIKIEDAEDFINLIKNVESNSDFMLLEPGERKITLENQRNQIKRIEQQSNSTIFVAEDEGNLVGYLIAIGGEVKRTRHSAYLVIGVLEEYRGKGLGASLLNSVTKWAKEHNISRLELTTVTQNEAGIALYKKNGFEIEGIKRNSLVIDGTPFDEYYMSKLF